MSLTRSPSAFLELSASKFLFKFAARSQLAATELLLVPVAMHAETLAVAAMIAEAPVADATIAATLAVATALVLSEAC